MSGLAFGAIWLWLAVLTAGYARARSRSAWTWFVVSVLLGPIAGIWLFFLPVVPRRASS